MSSSTSSSTKIILQKTIKNEEINQQISLEELSETIGVVNEELITKNYNMEVTFKAWIVCCPPIIKKHQIGNSRPIP
jgi:hypothetical protein